MSKPAPRATIFGPAPCACCRDENPYMYEGTDGTVYCLTCSLRGGQLINLGCSMCNDEPRVVTRLFEVKFK